MGWSERIANGALMHPQQGHREALALERSEERAQSPAWEAVAAQLASLRQRGAAEAYQESRTDERPYERTREALQQALVEVNERLSAHGSWNNEEAQSLRAEKWALQDFLHGLDRKESQMEASERASAPQSPGERLLAYHTDLKAHLREQEQLGLPMGASERRQEVLAFAEHWQAQHGPVHGAERAAQREYVAVQAHVAERREAHEQTPVRAQGHETERERG